MRITINLSNKIYQEIEALSTLKQITVVDYIENLILKRIIINDHLKYIQEGKNEEN